MSSLVFTSINVHIPRLLERRADLLNDSCRVDKCGAYGGRDSAGLYRLVKRNFYDNSNQVRHFSFCAAQDGA